MGQQARSVAAPTKRIVAMLETTIERLQGRKLTLTRFLWLASAFVMVGAFLLSLPPSYNHLLHNTGQRAVSPALHELTLTILGVSAEAFANYLFALDLLLPLSFIGVGVVIFWRKPDEWLPLLFSHLLIMFGVASTGTVPLLAEDQPQLRLAVEALNLYGLCAFFLFAFLFPDGRLVPRWTWLPLLFWILVNIAERALPGTLWDVETWPEALNTGLLVVVLGSVPFAQVYRFRRVANPVQRQQTKWVIFGLTLAIGVNMLLTLLKRYVPAFREPNVAGVFFRLLAEPATIVVFLLIPLTLGMAILRYRLWHIDPVIRRTVLYASLTASVVIIYGLVIGYLSLLFQTQVNVLMALAATAVVAVVLHPLHGWLQRVVKRLLYGDEPYKVIARLGQQLEATLVPEVALQVIVQTVKDALKLPYVAVALGHSSDLHTVAAIGILRGQAIILPLMHGAEIIGELRVAPRDSGQPLEVADQGLLAELARQAGAVAYTAHLTADLQRTNAHLRSAREQLVLTREEERRRLRRDLHDGLGPALAALSLKVGATRRLLGRDDAAAERLLGEISSDIEHTVGDIRRLVYNLRPPALDELGLVGALCQSASAVTTSGGVQVIVDAPDRLPALPAAVEVAAYRIVQEAVTNVVRHAKASTCTISLCLEHAEGEPALMITIDDDGVGLAPDRLAGVGLLAMRERATEVGGTLRSAPLAPQGTRVWAILPAHTSK